MNQGATYAQRFIANTSNGANPPVLTVTDLTGCTASMMIRTAYNSPTALLTLTTANGELTLGGTTGTIDVLISASQTLSLPVFVPAGYLTKNGPPSQFYAADLDVTFPSTSVVRYANFVITLYKTVTY